MAEDIVKNVDIDDAVPEEAKPEDRGGIVFYCKDCEKIVATDRVGMRYVYKCKKCKTKNVAFGTEASIKKFFHIEEDPMLTSSKKPATSV